MYSRIELPDHMREGLIALERELGVPIRAMAGSGNTESRPRAWTAPMAGEHTLAEAQEHGLTWTSAGAYSGSGLVRERNLDNYAGLPEYTERCGYMRYSQVFVPRDGTDAFMTELYSVAGHPDQPTAEIREREVYDWVFLTSQTPTWDFDTYVGDLLRLAHDPAWREQLAGRQAERRAAAFQGLVRRMEDNHLNHARQQIETLEGSIASNAAAIGRWTRDLNVCRAEIEARQQAIIDNRGPETMWAELENHARVTNIELAGSGSRILVTTNDIILRREDGEERWLGPFLLTFNLTDAEILMANKGDTRRGNRDHPHVNNGVPCLGDLQPTLTRAVGEMQLLYALELCLQYLETLNLRDDWGQFGAWWFDVPDARETEANVNQLVEA